MYKFHNSNALGLFRNDCVVRSISVAENTPWDYTYDKLSDLAQREGTLLDDMYFVENYLDERYDRVPFIGKTVGEFASTYNEGVYLVTMAGHITVIINGVVYDTFDCRNRKFWTAWYVRG